MDLQRHLLPNDDQQLFKTIPKTIRTAKTGKLQQVFG